MTITRSFLALIVLLIGIAQGTPIKPPEFPKGTVKVVAYLYDYTVADSKWITADRKLHPGVIPAYTRTLSNSEIDSLVNALAEKHERRQRTLQEPCPHHGIVFYGKGDTILGSLSVSFDATAVFPNKWRPLYVREPLFSFFDWKGLRELFNRLGMPILDDDAQYSALRTKGEQAVPSDGHKPPNRVSSAHPTAPADAH